MKISYNKKALSKKSQNHFCIINFVKVYKPDNQLLLEYAV